MNMAVLTDAFDDASADTTLSDAVVTFLCGVMAREIDFSLTGVREGIEVDSFFAFVARLFSCFKAFFALDDRLVGDVADSDSGSNLFESRRSSSSSSSVVDAESVFSLEEVRLKARDSEWEVLYPRLTKELDESSV